MTAADKEALEAIWWAGVRAVGGSASVAAALAADPIPRPDAIAAVGKAAAGMAAAALATFGPDVPSLVVTKDGHARDAGLSPQVQVLEASHPVPDARSVAAGRQLLEFVGKLPREAHLLLLVSGGASALAEVPADGWTLASVRAENARLLASGMDIHAMNARRRSFSQIKGGRLLAAFPGARVTILAISDVEGDDVGVIGSGIGAVPGGAGFAGDTRIVASNAIARVAAAEAAQAQGIDVLSSEEALHADVAAAAGRVSQALDGTPGLRIWGGEPTVVLPETPGEGGRNQALALLVAREIAGRADLTFLAAGTDGSDGPTDAAGGIVDGATWAADGDGHLARADSGPFLAARGALFRTGPTGTNVMDLALALQR